MGESVVDARNAATAARLNDEEKQGGKQHKLLQVHLTNK
jgi:hypothetical protein